MQQLTFGECVKRTWASAREAATQMPLLMLGAFAVYTVLGYVAFAGRPVPGEGVTPSGGLVFAANVASLLNSLVYLGFTVKIYRFVLLREGADPLLPLGGKPVARIFGVSMAIGLGIVLSMLVLYAVLRPRYSGGLAFISVVVAVAWILIGVRLCLLFPAISAGGRIDVRGAWHDGSGHFWNLVGVPFVAALPLMICGVAVLIALGLAGVTPAAFASPAWLLLLSAGQSAANILFALITSSSLAWLYRRYADRLPAPPES